MPRLTFTLFCLLIVIQVTGQNRVFDTEILLQNRHVWRGSQLGTAISVEPSVTLRKNRFSLNLWAAVTPNNSYSEVDLVPSYTFNSLKITVFDYYNPVPEEINQYLNFRKAKSRHSLELTLDNYSVEKPGLKWMIGTFLAGDREKETGNPSYSTYVELKYPFPVWRIQVEPIVGLTPYHGYYADRLALVNAGILFRKELKLRFPVKIPLRFSLLSNPYSGKNFIVFGAGIAI